MTDTPTLQQNEAKPSHFFQLSIRAWLAILFVVTFCLAELSRIIFAISSGTPEQAKLSEQFYSAVGMVVAFYMGKGSNTSSK